MKEKLWSARKRIWCGLPWTFTVYSFDEERFFVESGVFTKNSDEVRLYRIMDISLKRTFMQRIFGMGTIVCNSADKTLGNFEIINVKNSIEVKEQLSELIEKERNEKRVSNREYLNEESFDDEN